LDEATKQLDAYEPEESRNLKGLGRERVRVSTLQKRLAAAEAIYPRVPPGIFTSLPGVAHFLSFEEIYLYPRVPQGKVANPWGTLGYTFPGKSKYGYI
jgi:hypothetical protein